MSSAATDPSSTKSLRSSTLLAARIDRSRTNARTTYHRFIEVFRLHSIWSGEIAIQNDPIAAQNQDGPRNLY
jgi:hypothetical protein